MSVCLSVQELQCDVSVEEDSRQEWTFTLYDFDNNGKVTREVSVLSARWQPSGTGLGLDLSLLPLLLPGGGRARQGLVAKGCWECPGPSVSAAEAEWVSWAARTVWDWGYPSGEKWETVAKSKPSQRGTLDFSSLSLLPSSCSP